ncbi:MAG: hypothetical protein OTJ98_10665 [Dehalococcoidia bacterium]|nr:hypothetical protein [Dehalococcoidia bacterium]
MINSTLIKVSLTATTVFAGALVFLPSPGASAGPKSVPVGIVNFVAELDAADGTPYNGPIKLSVKQEGTGSKYSWGPFSTTCTAGVLSVSADLQGLAHTSNAEAYFWKPNASGNTGAESFFYLNGADGARAVSVFTPPAPGGTVALRDLQLSPAPVFGTITSSSAQGLHPAAELQIVPRRFASGVIHPFYDIHPITVGAQTDVYSWSVKHRAEFRVETTDGWASVDTYLNRGNTVSVNLLHQGAIVVIFDPIQFVDVYRVVIFDSATYSPFDPSAHDPQYVFFAADEHIETGCTGDIKNNDQSKRHFDDVSAGSYVMELWTDSSIRNATPAPVLTATVTVIGGQTTTVTFP